MPLLSHHVEKIKALLLSAPNKIKGFCKHLDIEVQDRHREAVLQTKVLAFYKQKGHTMQDFDAAWKNYIGSYVDSDLSSDAGSSSDDDDDDMELTNEQQPELHTEQQPELHNDQQPDPADEVNTQQQPDAAANNNNQPLDLPPRIQIQESTVLPPVVDTHLLMSLSAEVAEHNKSVPTIAMATFVRELLKKKWKTLRLLKKKRSEVQDGERIIGNADTDPEEKEEYVWIEQEQYRGLSELLTDITPPYINVNGRVTKFKFVRFMGRGERFQLRCLLIQLYV